MILYFGTGIGVTEEEIKEAEDQQWYADFDELMEKLDLFYCGDE